MLTLLGLGLGVGWPGAREGDFCEGRGLGVVTTTGGGAAERAGVGTGAG